jgi:hypothetical protein
MRSYSLRPRSAHELLAERILAASDDLPDSWIDGLLEVLRLRLRQRRERRLARQIVDASYSIG